MIGAGMFTKSFAKDLKKHAGDKKLLARIKEIILEVEAADSITAINNLKKSRDFCLFNHSPSFYVNRQTHHPSLA
jgi:hypothetical protein